MVIQKFPDAISRGEAEAFDSAARNERRPGFRPVHGGAHVLERHPHGRALTNEYLDEFFVSRVMFHALLVSY